MGKHRNLIFGAMLIVGFAFIYALYFTEMFGPTYKYVRLKDGKEFYDVKLHWMSDHDVRINGIYYTEFDIDSLAR